MEIWLEREEAEIWESGEKTENGEVNYIGGKGECWKDRKGLGFEWNYGEPVKIGGGEGDVTMCLYYTLMSHSGVVGVELSYNLGRSLMNTFCFVAFNLMLFSIFTSNSQIFRFSFYHFGNLHRFSWVLWFAYKIIIIILELIISWLFIAICFIWYSFV